MYLPLSVLHRMACLYPSLIKFALVSREYVRLYLGLLKQYYTHVDKKTYCTFYYLGQLLHREDGPAIESCNGNKEWYFYGKHHRADGPAIEPSYGGTWWYRHGRLHRTNGPAIVSPRGDMWWYVNGKFCYRLLHT